MAAIQFLVVGKNLPPDMGRARQVRFALITGSNDFRYGNILDIYHGGFARFGFRAKLFDVPRMGHTTADAATLEAALDVNGTDR